MWCTALHVVHCTYRDLGSAMHEVQFSLRAHVRLGHAEGQTEILDISLWNVTVKRTRDVREVCLSENSLDDHG